MRGMERAERPPEDLLPDVNVNVRDWVGDDGDVETDGWRVDDEDEEEDGDDDEDAASELSQREDSLSHTHLTAPSDPILIQSSPQSAHRLPLSHSRHSLSSRGGRPSRSLIPLGHSPSASPHVGSRPPLQHPSVPRVGSTGSLHSGSPVLKQLSHSPLDTSFDLNASASGSDHLGVSVSAAQSSALDPNVPRIQLYLLPLPSPSLSPLSSSSPSASSALPAVFNGPLLLPSSTTVHRVLLYLLKRLSNHPSSMSSDLSDDSVELLVDGAVLPALDSWEDVRGRWKGDPTSRMRVFYRRRVDGNAATHPVRENGHAHAVAVDGSR